MLSGDGQNTKTVKETKTIDIVPGSHKGQPVVFNAQGNQKPG